MIYKYREKERDRVFTVDFSEQNTNSNIIFFHSQEKRDFGYIIVKN